MNVVVSAVVVLKVFLMQAPLDWDRSLSVENRTELTRPYAEAVAQAAHTYWEAALLMAQAISETHMASYVIEGRCMEGPVGYRCDPKHGVPRARGPWQLHLEACRSAYEFPETSNESVMAEAECAMQAMRYFAHVGKDHAQTPNHAAFCGMGPKPWDWPGANKRVNLAKTIYRQLTSVAQ
jgi:hypothetical protein